jgi:hypothetical protein
MIPGDCSFNDRVAVHWNIMKSAIFMAMRYWDRKFTYITRTANDPCIIQTNDDDYSLIKTSDDDNNWNLTDFLLEFSVQEVI